MWEMRCYKHPTKKVCNYYESLREQLNEKANEYGIHKTESDFFSWFDCSFFGEFGSTIERIRRGV